MVTRKWYYLITFLLIIYRFLSVSLKMVRVEMYSNYYLSVIEVCQV